MTPPLEPTHTETTHSKARPQAEAELCARAAAALASSAPAVLVGVDGRIIAASAASRLPGGAVLPQETIARLARIVATLRPGRPRLERLRLPGPVFAASMAPATLACSLVVAGAFRAVLLAPPGTAQPAEATPLGAAGEDVAAAVAPAESPSTEMRPADSAVTAVSSPVPPSPSQHEQTTTEADPTPQGTASLPSPEPGSLPAPAILAAPARWYWRTDTEGRVRVVDPRLAEALGFPAAHFVGRNWAALGATEAVAAAVLAGGSFARVEARLMTADGRFLVAQLGGVPMRGDGMRGYALPLHVEAAAPLAQPLVDHTPSPPTAAAADDAALAPDVAEAMIDRRGTAEEPAPTQEDESAPLPAETFEPTEQAPAVVDEVPDAAPPAPRESAPPAAPLDDITAPAAPSGAAPAEQSTPASAVRVMLSIVPSSPNVVPLRAGTESTGEAARTSWAGLSAGERNAFREIARALGARLEGIDDVAAPEPEPAPGASVAGPSEIAAALDAPPTATDAPVPPAIEPDGIRRLMGEQERPILDRLPLGVLAYRGDELLYVNKALLEWSGHRDRSALEAAGGLSALFRDSGGGDEDGARVLTLMNAGGEPIPVEARLISAPWDGGTAMLYILRRAGAGFDERLRTAELALRQAESTGRELRAILDTATDGVVLIDAEGIVLSMNRSAEALFGYDSSELQGESFTLLFAPESRREAVDYLDGLASNGVASVLNDGREVVGRVREGGLIPLFMTVGRIGEDGAKFCAVLRDITQWKRAEEELTEAKRLAEKANLAKSDFLAKISHEIRTPLNAIIGFSEVMMEERFGPIENQRYRDYLRDIHASGGHLISLINDLLDLSKIEAGKLDLAFSSVALNEIVQQCMAIMQGQANRERIIIRSSLSSDLPPVVADARSMRQIVLNLVSNSIKFSRPGGQVILSTALTDAGEVVLRVRDTGIGMSEGDIATAMEPFRQLATSGRAGSGGTGLGLPLTKALAEANRASFSIRSAVDAGTMVEITFPSTRVLAE